MEEWFYIEVESVFKGFLINGVFVEIIFSKLEFFCFMGIVIINGFDLNF